MAIITLTTDMGVRDYYVAALKGVALTMDPSVTIVDISHHISPFSISEASYQVRSCISNFPDGTVHVVCIDDEPVINGTNSQLPSVMKYKGHYFVGNDNGMFSLILNNDAPEGFWQIDNALSNPKALTSPAKTIFIPVAVKLSQGEKIENLASPTDSWNRVLAMTPTFDEFLVRGHVMHIDYYGNAITNISKIDFERYKDMPFTIYFRNRDYYIDKISEGYNDVQHGERLAIFNDAGYLEIAINKGVNGAGGGASSLFGLNIGDVIRIELTPRGSAQNFDTLF